MTPKYFIENRYSFFMDALPALYQEDSKGDSSETLFEKDVQKQLASANRLLMEGKYRPALEKFLNLRSTILKVLFPQVNYIPGKFKDWSTYSPEKIAPMLIQKSAAILGKTQMLTANIPDSLRNITVQTPADLDASVRKLESAGFKDQSAEIGSILAVTENFISEKDYGSAAKHLASALDKTQDTQLIGALQHDLAILTERSGQRDKAVKWMEKSVKTFEKDPESAAYALNIMADMHLRDGNVAKSEEATKRADALRKEKNIFSIDSTDFTSSYVNNLRTAPDEIVGGLSGTTTIVRRGFDTNRIGTITRTGSNTISRAAARSSNASVENSTSLLSGVAYVQRKPQNQITFNSILNGDITVNLDANGATGLADFYSTLKTTLDHNLLQLYLADHTYTIAYLPQVYSLIIPMGIGDCYTALGSYADAEKEYLFARNYPYLNESVEAVNLWLRIADLYLDWGDSLYRQARNNTAEFVHAQARYELVLKADNTIDNNSNLYNHAGFNAIKARATNAAQSLFANPPVEIAENPRLLISLLRANNRLTQIASNLNFLGIGLYLPPFSFEYLQNLARYFAQHSAQMERMYIQFKQTAENETLRESQLEQQVEVANATVELENRSLRESKESKDVTEANLNYANVQRANAQQAAADFANVRWQLAELDSLIAWAGAAAPDQINVKIENQTYFNIGTMRRDHAIQRLSYERSKISHTLEANRLQREINSAGAYEQVAQQQVQQAEARIKVAEQRVKIAGLQEQHARENLAFLEDREFSSAMWYNLANEARRITRRYLDMAIEVATLMEKAYEGETGRDLGLIKLEYSPQHLNGLMGSDRLLEDIDFFSLDFIRTKAKKAPMKLSISLADNFPMAFDRLLSTGITYFETTLDHFDRTYPGYYLQKIKQVEVVFVGLGGTEGVHGTLRNIGLSKFRKQDGTLVDQVYPADVMPLSEYNVRNDAIVFQLESKDLRLFENNGVATMWQLDLPRSINTFNLRQILDIHLVVYYDGFFAPGLETQILAALPASGSSSRGISMRLYAPDEMFFLRNQGSAILNLNEDFFPGNQTNRVLTQYLIRAGGDLSVVQNLKLKVHFGNLNATNTFTLDAEGVADGTTFNQPLNNSLLDTWTFTVDAADNPQLVHNGKLDLSGLHDLTLFTEFTFDYL